MQSKRLLAIFMAVILTCFLAVSIFAAEDDPLVMAVEVSSSTAIPNQSDLCITAGDTVTVTITVDTPDLIMYNFSLNYNKEAFTLVGEPVFGNATIKTPEYNTKVAGVVGFYYSAMPDFNNPKPVLTSGTFVTLTFQATEWNETFGPQDFELSCSKSDFTKTDFSSVSKVTVTNGALELHDFTKVDTEGNCVEKGYTTYTCKHCDKVIVVEGTAEPLGHIDENKDHKCDRACGVEGSTALNMDKHVDENKDHKCDYGCETPIGACVDENFDHACDYAGCTKVFGTCEDKDPIDHKCDYGCGKTYGTCEDLNRDHACDYEGCTKVYGTCEDVAPKDHVCDYGCGKTYGTCEDVAPKDHKCDYGCTKTYGEHKDSSSDYDHICDYCQSSDVLENCADKDGDKDHKCDICGKDGITEHDYAPATCDAPATCKECSATTGEALKHEWLSSKKYLASAATCKAYAKYYKECKNCQASSENITGEHYEDIASGYGPHDFVEKAISTAKISDANCNSGSIYWTICSVCKSTSEGEIEEKKWEAEDKLTHKDKKGDGDHLCDLCDEVIEECTPGEAVQEKYVGATVAAAGSYDSVTYCTECNKELARTHVVIPKLDQQIVVGEYTNATIPESIKDQYNTVEMLQTSMLNAAIQQYKDVIANNPFIEEKDVKSVLKEVVLKYSDDNGETWHVADETHFPASGKLWVTLEIPADTNKTNFTFWVVHVFTTTANGKTPGDKEIIEITPENVFLDVDGKYKIKFQVTGLSPISIVYAETNPCGTGCTPGATQVENNVEPKCTVGGSYDNVVYCTVCNKELSRETIDVDALEHIDADTNHKCDRNCGEPGADEIKMDEHLDPDKDHKCNYGCDVAIGDHVDADLDHACDYGCAEQIGTCEDADKNHKCDYGCGKNYGACEDLNKDHVCDYEGCIVVHGTCEDADKDHKCDYGCGKTYGECVDANKDHKCDYEGCTQVHGKCEDANKDHKCDYGCGKTYGDHVDANKDHVCDYGCTEKMGTCEDADKDHKCDYGCGKTYGEHVDVNHDNYCDYGCSVRDFGVHEDKNKDHKCDYCGLGEPGEFGKHEDANKDHNCDYGCSVKDFGEHKDANKDHNCDYGCSVKDFGDHVDANKDHNCDYGCATKIGDHKDSATDADHICDYCKSTEVLEQCSDKTGDNDHKCDICGKDDVTAHTYADATCIKAKTCSECGGTDGAPLGHKFDKETATDAYKATDATCTDKATYYKSCSVCTETSKGATGEATFEHGDLADHATEDLMKVEAVAPTCTATGLTEGQYCAKCNATTIEQTEVPAKGHVLGDWVVEVEPKIGKEGKQTKTCSVCKNVVETEAIEAKSALPIILIIVAVVVVGGGVGTFFVLKNKKSDEEEEEASEEEAE